MIRKHTLAADPVRVISQNGLNEANGIITLDLATNALPGALSTVYQTLSGSKILSGVLHLGGDVLDNGIALRLRNKVGIHFNNGTNPATAGGFYFADATYYFGIGGVVLNSLTVTQPEGITTANSLPIKLIGTAADVIAATGSVLRNLIALTKPTGKLVSVENNLTPVLAIDLNGKLLFADSPDKVLVPGNATINRPSGKAAVANGASAAIITCAVCTTGSQVHLTFEDDPGSRTWVSVASGSFTVKLGAVAPGYDVPFSFLVVG